MQVQELIRVLEGLPDAAKKQGVILVESRNGEFKPVKNVICDHPREIKLCG